MLIGVIRSQAAVSAIRLSRMTRRDWLTIGGLCVLAAAVQALAMAGVAHVRGSATAYAYQSPDAEEYVSYARGIAWQGRYARIDHDGRQVAPVPDTWRTPGYPAVLAIVVRIFGDSTPVLLAFHQLLTLLTVPLLWLILRRFCSPRWALVPRDRLVPRPVPVALQPVAARGDALHAGAAGLGGGLGVGGAGGNGAGRWREPSFLAALPVRSILIRPIALPFILPAVVVVMWDTMVRALGKAPPRLRDRLWPSLLGGACAVRRILNDEHLDVSERRARRP